MKHKIYIFLLMLSLLVIGEVVLRELGFCNAVLVKADEDFEYIAIENQDRLRFGNRIYYNEYSMRSDNLDTAALKILGLGDSVLNGGVAIDQQDLVTSLLSNELSNRIGKKVQVLNISYKSWGPDNVYAYLQKYGKFDAKAIFLVVSSHDAIDVMDFQTVVGRDKNYPSSQYSLAYQEVIDRYMLPKIKSVLKSETAVAADYSQSSFNPGFFQLVKFSNQQEIPLLIYLHPELVEIATGQYNDQGKSIIKFAQKEGIPLVQGLEGSNPKHYGDHIHLNEKGHNQIYKKLLPEIEEFLR